MWYLLLILLLIDFFNGGLGLGEYSGTKNSTKLFKGSNNLVIAMGKALKELKEGLGSEPYRLVSVILELW